MKKRPEERDTRPIGRREAARALETLNAYRAGKSRLDARLIREEEWYRLRHRDAVRIPADLPRPTSAWLLNTILQKHADAMDSFPQAAILPREPDDRATAAALSAVLPAILERAEFEECYSFNWWEKLKHGTACYGVFWDPAADAGLGEIAIRPVDLLHLYWQPGVRELQRSRNLFLCELVDNESLDEQFPERRGRLRSSPEFLRQYVHDDAIDISGKSLVVDWYYKRRTADGRQLLHYARLVGEEVLYATENDPLRRDTGWYEHGQYPFVFDTLFPEKDSPHGFGYVAVCMEPQTYIDSLSGYILEHAAQSARQRWWNAVSSAVNEAEFLDPAPASCMWRAASRRIACAPSRCRPWAVRRLRCFLRKLRK